MWRYLLQALALIRNYSGHTPLHHDPYLDVLPLVVLVNDSGHIWSPRRLQGRIHLIWMRIGYLNHKYP